MCYKFRLDQAAATEKGCKLMQKPYLDCQWFTVKVKGCIKRTCAGPVLFNLLSSNHDTTYRLHRDERKYKHTGGQGSNSNALSKLKK